MRGKRAFKRIFALLCLVTLLSAAALSFAAARVKAAEDALTVGVPADRCPIFYFDAETKELTGIGVELMRYAAEQSGYSVTFRPVGEETLKEALDNPDYDVVMPFGSAISSASGKTSIVSENLTQTPFTLVTKKKERVPKIDHLHVGMLHSLAAGAETVKQIYPDMEISFYDTMPDCVKALRDGEVDALLHNSYVWSYVLQKPSYNDLAVQPSAMFSMDFRAGTADTPKGREIIARLNKGIAALTDTKRQAVILDHTSRKLYQYDFSDYIYSYGLFILMAILLFIALIIIAVQRVHSIRKGHEEKMQQLMEHDPLTGLLNMNGFRRRVEEVLRENADTPYFLAYTNIRNFKFINDSLGREAGDSLLKFWADKSIVTLSDKEVMGRIEGDHFAVLRLIGGDERMNEDEEKVFYPLEHFFLDQGIENRVQTSTGIYVLTPKDFRKIDVDHMVDLARVAEKRVRDSRKGKYEFYNPEQWKKGKRIAEIINYLPAAIKSGDIQVWYQPQINYETGKITGAEALCRWDHTKLGWLYPFDFIATLEEAGLIFDLDCFVWETVCKDLKRWNEAGERRTVSVNVSRDDIQSDRDLAAHFAGLIREYGVSPDQLHIEITETAYVENSDLLIGTTEKLRELGFQVEMDDFGSGYSSLHMLKEVPVDRIKLDLHFLTESGDLTKSRIIVSCMIHMVNQLGMQMIAEGVETKVQAEFLKREGCAEMQGYYFFKPMPVSDFEALFTK